MGLIDRIQTQGSTYAYNGSILNPANGDLNPPAGTAQSVLATINSPLHAFNNNEVLQSRDMGVGDPGFNNSIQNVYDQYLTGTGTLNLIPEASVLDLSGTHPNISSHGMPPNISNPSQALPYLDNLPL